MADLSQYSDEQLQGMLNSAPQSSGNDLSKYSSEQLMQMLNSQAPANEQPVMKNNPGNHPTYSAPRYNNNPITALAKGIGTGINSIGDEATGLANRIPGTNPKMIENIKNNIPASVFPAASFGRLVSPMLNNIPNAMPGTAASVAQGVGQTATESLPAVGMSTLMGGPLGFSAANGLKDFSQNKSALDTGIDMAKGAAMGKGLELAGSAGASLLNPLTRFGASKAVINTAGSMLGGGVAGAAVSGGDPSAVIQGAGLGAAFPRNPLQASDFNPLSKSNYVTQEQLNDEISKQGDVYRKILNPTAGEIKGLAKTGKNVDDAMELAAKHGLVINKDAGNKLDTESARGQLQDHIEALDDQLDNALQSNNEERFDLKDIARKAKSNYRANTINDLEYKNGAKHIDDQIDAAIESNGPVVDGPTLNTIKRGMWKTSYNQGIPNAQDAARSVGVATKNALENAYPDDENIKGINKEMGDNLTLDNILQKAHGRIIDRGKLGKYVSEGFGGLTGAAIGAAVPIPGLHELAIGGGAAAGAKLGASANAWQTDPARITGNWANRLKNINVTDAIGKPSSKGSAENPDVLKSYNARTMPMNGPIGLPNNAPFGGKYGPLEENQIIDSLSGPNKGALPSPKDVPYNPNQHVVLGKGAIKTPYTQGQETIVPPNLNSPLGLPFIKQPVAPRYYPARYPSPDPTVNAQGYPLIHNPLQMPGPKVTETAGALGNEVGPQPKPSPNSGAGIKALGLAGAIGLGSMFNPLNAQAAQKTPHNMIDMNKIHQIESSGNPMAFNSHSQARGLGQITPIVLRDWNNMHPNDQHTSKELFDADTNTKIGDWYMNRRIPQLLTRKGLPDTTTNRLVAYNAGISRVGKSLPKETQDYLRKYNQGE